MGSSFAYSWRAGSRTVTASLSVSSSVFVAYCTKAVEEVGSEATADCVDDYYNRPKGGRGQKLG